MKKTFMILGVALLAFTSLYFALYKILDAHVNTLPENSVRACQGDPALPRVLVLGDSITHGRVSADYVKILEQRHDDRFFFVNAGINGHLAYNAWKRLDEALTRCRPEIVIVLIGTNDVNATLSEEKRARYVRSRQLPRNPSLDWYETNLRKILELARGAGGVRRVAVFTIPPIGEDLDAPENRRVARYNERLQAAAAEAGAVVLPLFEGMGRELAGRPAPGLCKGGSSFVEAAVVQYYLLGRSWNEVSDLVGFRFSTDCIHLNERAALLMADLVETVL